MSIKQLPSDVIDHLKASVTITSLNGVVIELLKNSLDASAAKIRISLDFARGNCSVEDDGSGITPSEFTENGGLAKLHHTSKFPESSSVHGRRGNFLAALGGLSLLSIASKHHEHRSHNSLMLHNRQVLYRHCPAPPEQRLTFDHGTRVLVRDLFGSMPVRVKQRGLAREQRSDVDRDWNHLVHGVVSLLLSWPSGVVVTLWEKTTERELRLHVESMLSGTIKVSRLLKQASLSGVEDATSWKTVSGSSRDIFVSGCISLTPAPSRRSQFISIGIQPLDNTYGNNALFDEINKVFKHSDFGMDNSGTESKKDIKLRKGLDQWPMFHIQIRSVKPGSFHEDAAHDNRQSQRLEPIINLLHAISYGFLKNYGFRPRGIAKPGDRSTWPSKRATRSAANTARSSRQGTPNTEAPSRSQSPFDLWNRVKVGTAPQLDKARSQEAGIRKERLVGEDGMILCRPFEEPPQKAKTADPYTTKQPSVSGTAQSDPTVEQPARLPRKRQRLFDKNRPGPKPEKSEWLESVMNSWKNPIFEAAEQTVPLAYDSEVLERSHHWNDANAGFECDSAFFNWRLSKDALNLAEVVSQVDKKFILVKLPTHDNSPPEHGASMLAMLDQHAADERCQLEELMQHYFLEPSPGVFNAKYELLDKGLSFEMSNQEVQILVQHRDHFLYWGVLYTVASAGTRTVKVTGLPPSISERCKLEPRLVIDILRQEAWRVAESGVPTRARGALETEHYWISLFHACPRGILDLLHSRACRSAIMFNDVLTDEACEDLISRLSKCAFPFQCAHGRPSVAPLLDIGHQPRAGAWTDDEIVEDKARLWKAYLDG